MENFIAQWMLCGALFSIGNGKLLLGWGTRVWLKEPQKSRPAFYFPDYFLKNQTPWFEHDNYRIIAISQLIEYLSAFPVPPKKDYNWHNLHQSLFVKTFQDLQKKFACGDLEKGVPFIIESTNHSMDKMQLVKSLKVILHYISNNAAYLYGFWDENEGMLGASPEVLFRHNSNGQLETMACAGTTNIQENAQALMEDEKELHEHELVIRGITESLSPYGKVTKGGLQLLKLSKLMHLVTPIHVDLKAPLPFDEIVKALHPTPAVGAFPKMEGRRWLEEYQTKIDRVRFGAPAGYVFPEANQSNCYVALRNVQWNKECMKVAAGCGVVAGSQCEKEWAEIQLKLNAIKEMLAL